MKQYFLLLLLLSLISLGMVTVALPHEGDYRHMTGRSGYMIGQRHCGIHTVWFHDDDDDGVVDRCSGIFYNHGVVHKIPVELIIKDNKLTCGCQPITKGEGRQN